MFNASRYIMAPMIQSFKCKDTQALFETGRSRRFQTIELVATRKLAQLAAATTLEFLRSPPGNQLERLAGDRKGQYSIRINRQRSEEHTSELQSRGHLVCRLLLEKKEYI